MEVILFGDPTEEEVIKRVATYYQKNKKRLVKALKFNKNTPEPLTYLEWKSGPDYIIRLT